MATPIKHFLVAGSFVLAALGLCAAPASAAPESQHPKAAAVLKAQAKAKKSSQSSKAKKAAAGAAAGAAGAAAAAAASPADEPEPDITDTKVTDYSCELGNKITIYTNEKDDSNIALRWKKRLHRLARVGTTTGALRFENKNYGLVWIGIPSKGILLDSKLNRQLANECKNAEQSKPLVTAGLEEKKS